MRTRERANSIVKYISFIINPLVGFIVALHDLKSKSSFYVFFLFTVLFGVCFTVPSGRTADFTGDGAVYRARFDRMATKTSHDFSELYHEYIQFDEGEKDFYVTALSFIVSRFTNNYHYIFAIFAMVFGYFMLKSLKILTDEINFKSNSLYCFLLAVIFIMSNSIFNINGIRFWTAAWMGVYCILQIFLFDKKRYFLLALLTPFVHVSFFVYIAIILLAYFTRRFQGFWFVLFVISFFLSSFAKEVLKIAEQMLPAFISRTINLYTDQDVIAQINESKTFSIELFSFLENFAVNFTLFLFYRNRKKMLLSDHAESLLQFLLVWMTFVNFSIMVPSLGGRFLHLALPLLAYIWLVAGKSKNLYFNWLLFFLFSFSMDFLYQLRSILKVTEIDFYIGSPFYLIYHYLLSS